MLLYLTLLLLALQHKTWLMLCEGIFSVWEIVKFRHSHIPWKKIQTATTMHIGYAFMDFDFHMQGVSVNTLNKKTASPIHQNIYPVHCNYYFNFPDLFFFSFLSWLGDELRSFLDVCSCFSAFLAARDDGLGLLESSALDPLPLTLRYFFSFSVNKNHFVGHPDHENWTIIIVSGFQMYQGLSRFSWINNPVMPELVGWQNNDNKDVWVTLLCINCFLAKLVGRIPVSSWQVIGCLKVSLTVHLWAHFFYQRYKILKISLICLC